MSITAKSLVTALKSDDFSDLSAPASVDYGFALAKNNEHATALFGTYQLIWKSGMKDTDFHNALVNGSLEKFVASFFSETDTKGWHDIQIEKELWITTSLYQTVLNYGGIPSFYK